MVIWLLGISGSGKTTLGRKIQEYFRQKKIEVYLIDGDLVREFFENDLGYSKKDRIANIKRIIFGAYLLEQNNVITIVCNISPFEALREFARRKLKNYIEIFLERDIDTCRENDVKNVYKDNVGKTQLIGIDIEFDKPEKSDLILNTSIETEEESYKTLVDFIDKKMGSLNNENKVQIKR